MTTQTNLRSDEYSADKGLRVVHRILSKIREEAPPQFIVGIKLNAGDYATSGSEDRALEHVHELAASRLVDFIEISGGDYENPGQLFNIVLIRITSSNHPVEFTYTSTSQRQALFTRFSREALLAVASTVANPPLILLTGGFSCPAQLNTALDSKHADLLGIGRFSIICPDLPLTLRQNAHPPNSHFSSRPSIEGGDPAGLNPAVAWLWKQVKQIKLVGAGAGIAWYTLALRELSERRTTVTVSKDMGFLRAVCGMWLWLGPTPPPSGFVIFTLLIIAVSAALSWSEVHRTFNLVH